ncbi:hypothetical protein P3T23_008826 [Paraburkholderia sp. GAS448]
MTSSDSMLDLSRLYGLVAEIPAQICCGSQVHFPPTQKRGKFGLDFSHSKKAWIGVRLEPHLVGETSHVIAAPGVVGSGRVGGRDEACMLCQESGRYFHVAVEIKRPCSGRHFLPLDWVAVAVGFPQLTTKF